MGDYACPIDAAVFNCVLIFSCTINTVFKDIIGSLLNVFVPLQSGQFTPESLPEGWWHYWPVCFHGTSCRCQTRVSVCPFHRGWIATSDWLTDRVILTYNCSGGLLRWAKKLDFQKVPQLVAFQRDLFKHLSSWRAAAGKRRVESFRVAAWWRKISTKCSAALPLTCHHSCWSCLWLEHPAAACRIPLLHTDSLELCVASPTLQLLCVSGTISEGCFFPPLQSLLWLLH